DTAADSFGALAHAGKSPVPFAPVSEDRGIDAAAIVPYEQPEPVRVFELHLDVLGTRMVERIDERLAADAIHLITQQRMHRTGTAFHDHAKIHSVAETQFLGNL